MLTKSFGPKAISNFNYAAHNASSKSGQAWAAGKVLEIYRVTRPAPKPVRTRKSK